MSSPNILVVEDDAAHAELIGLAFEPDEGFHLRLAPSLREARQAIAETQPELVITDLLLPDGRGTDLLPSQGQSEFPIVVMTGHGDEQVAVDAIRAGAYNYLVKSAQSISNLPQIASSTLREWALEVERRRAEDALLASEKRYRTLFDNNPSMVFSIGQDGRVMAANRFAAAQLGHEADELVGQELTELHVEGEREAVRGYLETCFSEPSELHRWETCQLRGDGSSIWVNVSAQVVAGTDADPMALIVCEDVTEARRLSDRLAFHASHDSLTGLPNRRRFETRLQQVIQSARNQKSEHALCYLDLDQFKVINDTCGHGAGDELLKQISGQLKQRVRRGDLLARLGGDEFGVILANCSLSGGLKAAESLIRAVENFRFFWKGHSFALGVSIGLVPITENSGDLSALLTAADAACYRAKDRGRNRVHIYHEGDSELAARQDELQWISRIHTALEEGRFRLVCQPIVPITSDQGMGEHYEVLLRMIDSDGIEIPPGDFLTAAERYDLIQKIDRWVLEATVGWFLRNPQILRRIGLCSINISGRSIGDEEFTDFVVHCLEESGFPADKICFEVTETVAITDLTRASRFIETLKALGCHFALDDFGRGISSFGYLKELPVDFIKIDGMFVRDLAKDPTGLVLVKAIHDIGVVTGKKTIAEYVESAEILEKLSELGIDFAQGFFTGAPMPIDKLVGYAGRSPRLSPVRRLLRPTDSNARNWTDPDVPKSYRVLHVDDDPVTLSITRAGLERAGFEVMSASSGRQALDLIEERGVPHLALVDIFMPGMNGMELSRRIQSFIDLPIVMVTSVEDSEIEVDAIKRVAEDYIIKPFDIGVLVARVERLIRRIGDFDYALERRIRVDDRLEVEFGRRLVHVDGEARRLTRTESKLLGLLMRNPGQTMTTDFLLRRLWPRKENDETVLRTHVGRLRRKIEVSAGKPKYIVTRRGLGYSFAIRAMKTTRKAS